MLAIRDPRSADLVYSLPGSEGGGIVELVRQGSDGDPETEGVDAYCLGTSRRGCTYTAQTPEALAWVRGWDEAAKIDRENGANETDGTC